MAIDFDKLTSELRTDPSTMGYAPLVASSDFVGLAVLMNTDSSDHQVDRGVIDAHEVIDATASSEWAALSAAEKQRYQTITGAALINVRAQNTRSAFGAMFGVGTLTRASLIAIQTEDGSRSGVLFGGKVHHAHVRFALRTT